MESHFQNQAYNAHYLSHTLPVSIIIYSRINLHYFVKNQLPTSSDYY